MGIGAGLAGATGIAHADGDSAAAPGGSPADRASAASSPGPKATTKTSRTGSSKTGVSARVQPSRASNVLGSVKSKRPVTVATKPSGDQTPGAPNAEVLAAELTATTRRDTAASPDKTRAPEKTAAAISAPVANPPAEISREKTVAEINMSVGWVPGVGTLVNGISLVSDFVDFTKAALRGDAVDMRDEIGDMALDVVGMIPVIGAPVAATIYRSTVPGNRAPRPVDDSYSIDQDTQLTGNVLTNDTDADGDTLTATVDDGPSHGSLTLNSNGSFTYTPDENYYGTDSFSYIASDGNGGTAVATASIAVKYVAPPPVVDQQHPYTIDVTDPATGTISGHFNVTHDKPFTYHVVGAPDPALGSFELNEQTGEWTFTPNPRTRVLAGTLGPTSPAAVKLSFSATATDGIATTAPIVVTEHIAGADRAALSLPPGTMPVLSFVDSRTGNAYIFGYRGNLIDAPDDQSVSYLAAVIHADGTSSIPSGASPVSGLVREAFAVGDTTFVVSQTGGDESSFQTYLSILGSDGLTPLGEPIPGDFRQPLTVAGTTYLVTQAGTYESGYQTNLTALGPGGVTSTTEIPGTFNDHKLIIGDTTYLVTQTGTYESGDQSHLTALGPGGVTSTTEIPGTFNDRTLVVGGTTYLVTHAGTYDTGYQTHLTTVGPNVMTATTSIPGEFYEDSSGYSIVKGDITYIVTQSGKYDTGYDTNVTALGPDGGTPTVTIPGWSWGGPINIGDTTYLLVPTQSGNVTQAVALTSAGATPVGSIPGVLSGDPIVVGDTTYFISHIGDSGVAATWQSVVTTLAPTPGGVTVIGDPIPGYRWAMRPIVVGDTTYLVTETWNSSVGYETHLTALLPDGVAPLGPAILGTVSGNPTVVVVGETSYLITTARYYWNSDGTYAYTRTFLTAVQPEGLTRWGDPVDGYPGIAPITIGDTTYLVMETDDSPDGYRLQLVSVTASGVTPIGAPTSGRVNSHSEFDMIVVGDTTYLMVETPDSAGGHQTSLVKVQPGGLTAVPGTLPGHPVSVPIVVGDTTYLVTQTGQYDSAQTHFTALNPQGVLQLAYTVSGTLAYEPLIVAGDLTYVKTDGWEATGEGSHSTNHVYVTALTPEGPSSVDYPVQYGEPAIVVGDTTYLVSTVFPDESGIGTDTTKTYIVALTPHSAMQLNEPVRGYNYSLSPFVIGDATYSVFTSYPDDVDDVDDVTTYLVAMTADGPALVEPFPGLAPFYMDPIFTLGDTTYVTTTSGVWAIGVDAPSPASRL
ncbi:cadherin-like domain-containing protein [Mycolicibacterium aichiense]|uniref:cadherin-like domain-containing protein n=1 Tax=Mycolicibacterium aichiense TaxID=1799 RepID=UPI0011C02552|nr:cadherin-like domain-containing protein [Mycolicibacterium aichiense]